VIIKFPLVLKFLYLLVDESQSKFLLASMKLYVLILKNHSETLFGDPATAGLLTHKILSESRCM